MRSTRSWETALVSSKCMRNKLGQFINGTIGEAPDARKARGEAISRAKKGKPFTEAHRKALSNARNGRGNPALLEWSKSHGGDKSPEWKGEDVGYVGLHNWVRKCLGKPRFCMMCFSEKNLHWANLSHEYKRDLHDWVPLCALCHRAYDMRSGWGIAIKKYPELARQRSK